MKSLLTPGKDTRLIGLDLADLSDGETLELNRDQEPAAVVLSGVVDGLGTAGGRGDVFEGPGHTIYAPPGTPLRFRATGGPAQIVIATAPLGDGDTKCFTVCAGDVAPIPAGLSRVAGLETPVRRRGEPAFGGVIASGTAGRAGTEPRGSKACGDPVRPPRCHGSMKQEAAEVPRTRHRLNLRHSCRRARQLWVMAGEGRQMIPYLDPEHAWVQNG